jgi:hypothetical protein
LLRQNWVAFMVWFSRSRLVQVVIASLALILCAIDISTAVSIWRADWLRDQANQQSLGASARLLPWDARTYHLLGRYLLYAAQDADKAQAALGRAVELNAYDGSSWLDLAEAYELAGDLNRSRRALQQALWAEPTSTEVAWNVANRDLVHNDTDQALPLFRSVLEHNDARSPAALSLSWRTTRNIAAMTAEVLPERAESYFALLKILISENEPLAANELWRALVVKRLHFRPEEAFPYFDYLIRTAQTDQAKQVWDDLENSNSALKADPSSNLVRNGGFETDPLNGGFDWRISRTNQVEVSVDTGEFHKGLRSLHVSFSGPAVEDTGVYEYVPVEANTEYRLSTFVKTQGILTASGPRLAAQDGVTGDTLALTDEIVDSSDWLRCSALFTTGPNTHLLALRIVRKPGNSLIKGSLWLDDTELKPVSLAAQGVMP